ncbi:Rz1 family lipoprotein [Arsenophonus endosymbiont of Aleurodicus floccissimus]|uniref:Rz1 family lipoprotein n=1 Tax=Arsenophonus endosymbiont of Aleurodicus floccissimus TaxID=2152761 RepID=UPI0034E240E9
MRKWKYISLVMICVITISACSLKQCVPQIKRLPPTPAWMLSEPPNWRQTLDAKLSSSQTST